ncbi:MAG: hypothetical protein JXN63_06250 [Candidatus Delongbacteria bacterium]|nr:hypothetical protein [Candidatus Delongbacteria bacterium]
MTRSLIWRVGLFAGGDSIDFLRSVQEKVCHMTRSLIWRVGLLAGEDSIDFFLT